jgi:hypothetical protein
VIHRRASHLHEHVARADRRHLAVGDDGDAARLGARARGAHDARERRHARRDVATSRADADDARSSARDDDDDDDDDRGATDGDDGLSSSFADEVARRGGARASTTRANPNPFDRDGASDAPKPPRFAPNPSAPRRADESDQLARSRALQSEGLEGFPARATELLKTGFAVFLGFGPFVAAISVVFCATYFLFGSDFIHGGEGYGAPAFVPAEVLLGEPTVDPTVPFASGDAQRAS